MDNIMKDKLIKITKEKFQEGDPAHDISHTLRVLKNAEFIASKENGDLDIIIPSALFHDIICYPKNSEKSKYSSDESADFAVSILKTLPDYPKYKISKVHASITQCSFSKQIVPELLEAKILQDADRLEATGAISIMRTFASAGLMNSELYNFDDPFCKKRKPDSLRYALDLFYNRLLIVKDFMHTETAKNIAEKRTKILYDFLNALEEELYEI
ncbi:HD domain-containing protein [Clostridium baratii]|uniref:HD domain-containing protein n=1 Tax=Clostridium baratii TaxID=1561 RepID=UPI00069AD09D|nr:HD domain-containing protein [Clostridium baratii]